MQYTGFEPQSVNDKEPALSLDRLLCSPTAYFARMQGNAMARAGIRHGDLLVVEPAEHYRDQQIVLAFIHEQAYVRRLERTPTGYLLSAANPHYSTLDVGEDCLIRGQVVASITLLAARRIPLLVVI